MKKINIVKEFGFVFAAAVVALSVGNTTVYADETADETAVAILAPYEVNIAEDFIEDKIAVDWKYDGTAVSGDGTSFEGFEVYASMDEDFAEASTAVYKVAPAGAKYSCSILKDVLGDKGGYLFVKVRAVGKKGEDTIYSEFACPNSPSAYVKICTDNFMGMNALIKNGYDAKRKAYDTNKDGWLSPKELNRVTHLTNFIVKKGKIVYNGSKPQEKVTGFSGIEYFTNLNKITINGYAKPSANLSKTNAKFVEFKYVNTKNFTLNAPNALDVRVSGNEYQSKSKLKSVNISKCNQADYAEIWGTYTSYVSVKLPSSGKKLKVANFHYIKGSVINVNKYSNLLELGVYFCQASTIKANSCKELRYANFYISTSLKSVDLSKCKKLRGIGVSTCGVLTSKNVKTPAKCIKKDGKNAWYQTTKAYKKQVLEKLYK